jgi:hypothetical protein
MPRPEENNYTNHFSIHRTCRFFNLEAAMRAVIR